MPQRAGFTGLPTTLTPSIFTYGDHQLRTVDLDGDPWFVAADVCRCLGLNITKGTTNALRPLSDDEKRPVTPQTLRGSGSSLLTLISESGLYKLALRAQRSKELAREI